MSLTEAQINTIYGNVLQRSATSAEQTSWFNQDVPQGPLSDGSVVTSIVQLPEVTNYVDPVIALYQAVFGRVPDAGGLKANVDAIDPADGGALPLVSFTVGAASLAAAFVSDGGTAGEFYTRYGIDNPNQVVGSDATSTAFLQALYGNVLGRVGAPVEIAAWSALGQTVSQVLYGFFASAEFQSDAAAPEQELLTDDAQGVTVPGFAGGAPGEVYSLSPTILGGSLFAQNMTFESNTQGGALDMSQPAYAGQATSAYAYVGEIELLSKTGGTGGMNESGDLTITNAPPVTTQLGSPAGVPAFTLKLNDDAFTGQNITITPSTSATATSVQIDLGATSGVGTIGTLTFNSNVSGGLIHEFIPGYATATIDNVVGSNAIKTVDDFGGLAAALDIIGTGTLSLGTGTLTVGTTEVEVGSATGLLLLGTINGTITDTGVTLDLGVTNAVKIDASAAPQLLMFAPDDYSTGITGGQPGITVLGGSTGPNLLQGALDAVTAIAGVGVSGPAYNDTITGGAAGGDAIFGDGGSDTINLGTHAKGDTIFFGEDALGFSNQVLAITNTSDDAFEGYWGDANGTAGNPLYIGGPSPGGLNLLGIGGNGGTSADMTTINNFVTGTGSAADVLTFKVAAWAGGTPGVASLTKGVLFDLDTNHSPTVGNASLSPIWSSAASNAGLSSLQSVLLYAPTGDTITTAAELASTLDSAAGAVTLPVSISAGQNAHILVAYDASFFVHIGLIFVLEFAVNIADVDLINTSGGSVSATNAAGLDVLASDMVHLTGVTLSSLVGHNIQFA